MTIFVTPRANAEPSPQWKEQTKDLVVMIKAPMDNSAESFGTGIIVAHIGNRAYIVTARHVIAPSTVVLDNIQVQFRQISGKWLTAVVDTDKILNIQDVDKDASILRVDLSTDQSTSLDLAFGFLGDVSRLAVGDDVNLLGYPDEQPWMLSVQPEKVTAKSAGLLRFRTLDLKPGNSGGPLLNGCDQIVGMIMDDQAPDGLAVPVDNLLDAIQSAGVSVQLSPASTNCVKYAGSWNYLAGVLIGTPAPISPADGATLNAFPRITTLQWNPVSYAERYRVQVQMCIDFPGTPNCSTVHDDIMSDTFYTFQFGGKNRGRWRVATIDPNGNQWPWCDWETFVYSI
jgi:S1-C subfamily serine protease